MRASFSQLGIKLSLPEAKALIQKQSAIGDRGGESKNLQFNYRDFLSLYGAEISRSDALKREINNPDNIDIRNPVPPPSAAQLIIERLQRERAPITEGWMYSVLTDQPKMKPPPEGVDSELDKRGGLSSYVAESKESHVSPSRKKNVPPAMKGEFTNAGIGAWNSSVDSVHLEPKHVHGAYVRGEIDTLGGLEQIAAAPLFPEDAKTHHILHSQKKTNHVHYDAGDLVEKGGLMKYLSDTSAPKSGVDVHTQHKMSQHRIGDFTTSGISDFIHDPKGLKVLPSGYIPDTENVGARKGFDDSVFSKGSIRIDTSSSKDSEFISNSEVPVMPEDIVVVQDFSSERNHIPRAPHVKGHVSQIDSSGGLFNYVTSSDPRVAAPVPVSETETRRVGHISKAGGLSGWNDKPPELQAGLHSSLSVSEFAKNALTAPPPSHSGQLDKIGGLGRFISAQDDFNVPVGYQTDLYGQGVMKKISELDKAMIGTLDRYGGIAGFYNANAHELDGISAEAAASGKTASGAKLVAVGTSHIRQYDGGSLQRIGKLEQGGIGAFMNSSAQAPEGFVAPLPGQNDDAPREVRFANVLRGEIESKGGLIAFLEKSDDVATGYVLYPGELAKRNKDDPLHHYTSMGEGFMGQSMDVHRLDSLAYNDPTLKHERDKDAPKLYGGRVGKGGDREVPETAVQREISLVGLQRERRDILNAMKMENEREILLKMDPTGASSSLADLQLDRKKFEKSEEKFDPLVKREVTMTEAREEGLTKSRIIMDEAIREVLKRQEAPPGSAAPSINSSASSAPSIPSSSTEAKPSLRMHSSSGMDTPTNNESEESPTQYTPVATYTSSKNLVVPTPIGVFGTKDDGGAHIDLRKLARLRKVIRDVLPKKDQPAKSVIRSRLGKEDGDSDGVISEVEFARGLSTLNPSLTSSDIDFLVNYMRLKAKARPENLLPPGFKADITQYGLSTGIDVGAVADWVTRQPGGFDSKAKAEDESAGPIVVGEEARISWNSRSQKFVAFRSAWEERHGAPAMKEMAMDLQEPVTGPTWAKADPQPFKVLKLAISAPVPPKA